LPDSFKATRIRRQDPCGWVSHNATNGLVLAEIRKEIERDT